jgi:hypothetical protein
LARWDSTSHYANRQASMLLTAIPLASIAHLMPASSAKRLQSNRQRNAEVCHGYI